MINVSELMQKQKTRHSPTLDTVRMVEQVLKEADEVILKIPEIKRRLPKQVNHNTLKTVLEYLEESGKIYVGIKGISWIPRTSPKTLEAISEGKEF